MRNKIDLVFINGSKNSALYINSRLSYSECVDKFNYMRAMLDKEIESGKLNNDFEFTITEYEIDDAWLNIRKIKYPIDYPNNFRRIPKKWMKRI